MSGKGYKVFDRGDGWLSIHHRSSADYRTVQSFVKYGLDVVVFEGNSIVELWEGDKCLFYWNTSTRVFRMKGENEWRYLRPGVGAATFAKKRMWENPDAVTHSTKRKYEKVGTWD